MNAIFLNARSEPIKINYEVTHPQLDIQTTPSELAFNTEPYELDIQTTPGDLEIDSAPWRYSLGLKDWSTFFRDNTDKSKQMVIEATERFVADGNRMAAINILPAPAGQIAFDNMLSDSEVSINIGRLEPPNISYTPGTVAINYTPAKVHTQINPGTVDINLQRGTIEPQINQYPRVEFWISENRYDIRL